MKRVHVWTPSNYLTIVVFLESWTKLWLGGALESIRQRNPTIAQDRMTPDESPFTFSPGYAFL
jgi:hypothetical protein